MDAEEVATPDPKLDINYRGQYPPVAILANTRRALSHSYNSTKRQGEVSDTYRQDMLHAYQVVMGIETTLRLQRNIPGYITVPNWVYKEIQWREDKNKYTTRP